MKNLVLLIALGLGLAGCSQAASPYPVGSPGQPNETRGDVQEKTASVNDLPTFLASKPEQTKQVYRLAAENVQLLQYIPCYCGCGGSVGHTSNADCFVKEVSPDGIIWDSHGSKCGVCMDIAAKSVKLKSEGKSPKDIRAFIDAKYEKTGVPPTATPLPN